MWNKRPKSVEEAVTCIGCGLSCDDLRIEVEDSRLVSLEQGCALSWDFYKAAFKRGQESSQIEGKAVAQETALDHIVGLLNQATSPLFAGLMTDVNGMRGTLELADRCGALLDHQNSDALFRNLRVLQDSGWFATTFTEARNRADLFVMVGQHWFERFPRLIERILAPSEALFSPPQHRRYILLAPWDAASLPSEIQSLQPTIIPLQPQQLADAAGLLRGMTAGRPVDTQALGKTLAYQLDELAGQLKSARYSVLSWSAAEMDFPHAELTIQRLVDLVKDLNFTTRSAVLPLAGSLADTTSNQVCTWQLGYPLRSGMQRGHAEHEPLLNRYQDLLERREPDLLLWISAMSPRFGPPQTDIPTIVLGHPGMTFDIPPEVYMPVGIPSIDHPGHWYRSDAVCPLPLGQLRASISPSVGEVMATLNQRLQPAATQ